MLDENLWTQIDHSCCLDIVAHKLNCVAWWHILPEIEFESRGDVASDSNASGITHEQ